MRKAFIPGTDNSYSIFEDGSACREPHYIQTMRGSVFLKYKTVPENKSQSGYLSVHTRQRKRFYIHRLVAEFFVPNDNPSIKTQVNHIDKNPLNNHYTNLEWVSPSENIKHSYKMGRTTGKGIKTKKKFDFS